MVRSESGLLDKADRIFPGTASWVSVKMQVAAVYTLDLTGARFFLFHLRMRFVLFCSTLLRLRECMMSTPILFYRTWQNFCGTLQSAGVFSVILSQCSIQIEFNSTQLIFCVPLKMLQKAITLIMICFSSESVAKCSFLLSYCLSSVGCRIASTHASCFFLSNVQASLTADIR